METYSFEQAKQHALDWCNNNPGWKRICDIENTDALYCTFSELPKKEQKYWLDTYGEYSAESAWREFGRGKCKVPYGFITGKGEFYDDVLKVPLHHNLMQVYKVGKRAV
ncbi:hypothetical protein ABEO98_21685 [Brevibacillus parabrevis]|jgi:hypothetical protein|uniref:hypothetical protein n=1 Tax=Brevibacillus parabrevis TaxID=54914 RepID=UPI002490FF3B|nr:hypothetical protein [Brevibacillus parabrevis]MED2258271.1 hypothetical protein [Brevibacillus parabrevis]